MALRTQTTHFTLTKLPQINGVGGKERQTNGLRASEKLWFYDLV
jgi:hypothetical protein